MEILRKLSFEKPLERQGVLPPTKDRNMCFQALPGRKEKTCKKILTLIVFHL